MLMEQDQRLNCYKFDWSKTGLLPFDWSDINKHQICSKTVISKLIVGLKTHYVLSSKMDITLPGPVCWISLLFRYLSFTSFW